MSTQEGVGSMGPEEQHPGAAGGNDAGDDDSGSGAPQPGRIRRQEPGVTTPRPPTVGEARARDKARKARAEQALLEAEQAAKEEAKRKTRRRAMIGTVAVVGVVGLVALGYTVLSSDEVRATCIDPETEVVVDDSYCGGGMFIYAGSSYRYYYGGNAGGVGTKVSGGTIVTPKGATITTKSGTTIQRGGFGSKFSGSTGS
jgi:hypothetical protein